MTTWKPNFKVTFSLFILSEFKGYFFEWLNSFFLPFFFWVTKKGRKFLNLSCIFSFSILLSEDNRFLFSYRAYVLTADFLHYLALTSSSIRHLNADLKGDLSGFKFLLRMNEFQKHSVLVPFLISFILFCTVLPVALSYHFS